MKTAHETEAHSFTNRALPSWQTDEVSLQLQLQIESPYKLPWENPLYL